MEEKLLKNQSYLSQTAMDIFIPSYVDFLELAT